MATFLVLLGVLVLLVAGGIGIAVVLERGRLTPDRSEQPPLGGPFRPDPSDGPPSDGA